MSPPLELRFLSSATSLAGLPATAVEVATVGRSNVGKSSLINALANRKELARVSATPGRTQLLNIYGHGPGGTIVDLPGYGFNAAGKQATARWAKAIPEYLLGREQLAGILVLVDGEIGPTRLDADMLAWLEAHQLPYRIVATKFDKVKPSKRPRRRMDLAEGCGVDPDDVAWVSALRGSGIDALRGLVRALLDGSARL